LKEEALDRTMWRVRFGRGFGPVVRQTTKWMTIMYSCSWLIGIIKTVTNIVKHFHRKTPIWFRVLTNY
jgi:hypothetical protein